MEKCLLCMLSCGATVSDAGLNPAFLVSCLCNKKLYHTNTVTVIIVTPIRHFSHGLTALILQLD